jgi:hypothetical protein
MYIQERLRKSIVELVFHYWSDLILPIEGKRGRTH